MILSSTNFLLSSEESLCTMMSGVFVGSSPAILAAFLRCRGRISTTIAVSFEDDLSELSASESESVDGDDEVKEPMNLNSTQHESVHGMLARTFDHLGQYASCFRHARREFERLYPSLPLCLPGVPLIPGQQPGIPRQCSKGMPERLHALAGRRGDAIPKDTCVATSAARLR
jgi:hypothetical protein